MTVELVSGEERQLNIALTPIVICTSSYDSTFPNYMSNSPCIQFAQAFKPTYTFTATQIRILISRLGTYDNWPFTQVLLYDIDSDNVPGNLLVESSIAYTWKLPTSPTYVDLELPSIKLYQNVAYAFAIHGHHTTGYSGTFKQCCYRGKDWTCPWWYLGGNKWNALKWPIGAPGGVCDYTGKPWLCMNMIQAYYSFSGVLN